MTQVLVLNDLGHAEREIQSALAQGDVATTTATAQCLWALCGDYSELDRCFDRVFHFAEIHLASKDCDCLATVLSDARHDVLQERLLAVA